MDLSVVKHIHIGQLVFIGLVAQQELVTHILWCGTDGEDGGDGLFD